MIPYGRQSINADDISAVVEVLQSDFLTQGPAVSRFEDVVTHYCGARFGVAVNSATSALHIACLALGVGPGDRVWTSPITFVASANCALYCGAEVDFVDIDKSTYNIDPAQLASKLARADKDGTLPKAIVVVHLTGQPCDMAAIKAISQQYGVRIIEDASHAIGARYRREPVGNCQYSDITVFSFHPVKIVTTAEGGLATTNDAELAQRMVLFRSHGVTRDLALMANESHGPWYYEQIELGYNYRMTDIQAALGISQMQRIDTFVERRRELAVRYDDALSGLPLQLPHQAPDSYSSYHLYVVKLRLNEIPVSHRTIFESLREAGFGVNLHYIPIYLQPYYAAMGFARGLCPNAEDYYAGAMSLPMFPDLQEGDQLRLIETLKTLLAR